ncbi:uncharacterized protein LOC143590195 isoform X2 [Bidens hawaiensis]|uniref:uncharacterized protein LOC143581346 isoform X2 n=1 Tax=Bidens hawaiensis TaxID=980011 RepID=UPI0040496267
MAPATADDDGLTNNNMIFITTSLDTHLAMIVSHSDTVFDFKRKVMLEHSQLFPAIGDITVESLKVKQRGIFYHLSDSMLVKSAFNAAKRNWFVSVDASRVEQNDGVQHTANHKAGDQLALPWVTHSHGSSSDHSKMAPLVNQKALNVDQLTSGDSCKDVSKNVEEDRICSDKQLDSELQPKLDTVNADKKLKKRTRDVHNESSPKDGIAPGSSAKKKRKTRGKSDVKALEENLALTHVNDKVNHESTFENKTEGKDLRDENTIINKGESCSPNDQVATNVVTTEGAGSETVGDVAMVVGKNIQQEMSAGMSQKEKDNELVRKPAMEDEMHSSLMRTPDCEHDAAEVTVAGHMKHLTEPKVAEKEVSSTSVIEKLHNSNESSPKDGLGPGPSVKKRRKSQRVKNNVKPLEEKLALTHDSDMANNENTFKDRTEGKDSWNENNRISKGENCSAIDQAATDVITEGVGSETVGDVAMVVENMQEDKSVGMPQKEKDNELVLKTVTESSAQQDVGSNGQERAGDQIDKHKDDSETSLKQKPELKLPERKKGAKGSENISEGKKRRTKKVFKHAENLVGDILSTVIASVVEGEINEVSENTLIEAKKGDDVIMKEVEVSVENVEEKSRKEFTDTSDVVAITVTNEDNRIPHSASLMNNDADVSITEKNTSPVNAQGVLDDLAKSKEKTDDTTKRKKKRKTKKSSGRNEDELITKRVDGDIIENADIKDGDKEKEKEAHIELRDLPSKHQSTEVELESKKSQSVDHHHLPEKIATESEVSKVNNEVDIPEDGSHKLESKDNLAPSPQLKKIASIDNKKDMKKTQVSVNVFKDPNMTNIDKMKTPKRTRKIYAQKTNKQQPNLVQTLANTVEKRSSPRSQKKRKRLSGTIFGNDSDDINAYLNKYATSRKSSSSTQSPSSSSSSSSGEIISRRSYAKKGNEGAGKNNINSQSKLKNTSIGNLLRSSSAFKKAKVTASSQVEDSESQPVDVVPESQL